MRHSGIHLSRLFLLCLVPLLVGGLVRAETLTGVRAENLRKKFEAIQRGTRFWSAHFHQTLTIPGLKTPLVSEGKIQYRSPDAIRVEFENPPGDFLLARGEKFFLKKAGKPMVEKSLEKDAAAKPIQGLLSLLRGAGVEEERWFSPEISRQGDDFVVELVKKEGAPLHLPRSITNTVGADSFEMKRVVIQLPKGGSLTFQFDQVVRNRSIDASAFDEKSVR